MKFLFRALRSRNYRLYFAGQMTSLAGTWMSLMAMGWLVYRLTQSELMLGLLGFCMHAPTFALSPVAGALVDRTSRRAVMVAAQSLDMVVMFVLAVLTLGGWVEVWHVLTGCGVLGVAKAFDMPARQSLVVEIIEHRDDLSNAIALNSSMFHGARLVGPVLGGLVIGLASTSRVGAWLGEDRGEGLVFLIDGVSYLAVIGSLLALRLTAKVRPATRKHLLHDMKEGFMHAYGFGPMRAMMMLIGAMALLGVPYGTLLPVFASQVLEGNERTYSLLMSAGGLGAFAGAMYLASRRSVLGLGRVIAMAVVMFGLSLVLFACSSWLWLSLVMLVMAGGTSMVAMAGTNTIVQTMVDDTMRGRVMSFYGMTFMGAMPAGALAAGQLATILGAPVTVMVGGTACAIAGLVFGYRLPRLRAAVRPIYIERGIIPAMTRATPGRP